MNESVSGEHSDRENGGEKSAELAMVVEVIVADPELADMLRATQEDAIKEVIEWIRQRQHHPSRLESSAPGLAVVGDG